MPIQNECKSLAILVSFMADNAIACVARLLRWFRGTRLERGRWQCTESHSLPRAMHTGLGQVLVRRHTCSKEQQGTASVISLLVSRLTIQKHQRAM